MRYVMVDYHVLIQHSKVAPIQTLGLDQALKPIQDNLGDAPRVLLDDRKLDSM